MQLLQALNLDSSLPLIGCTATTRQLVGAWPLSFFASVLTEVVAIRPANIVLFGAASDEISLQRIANAVPSRVHVVAGTLDLLSFAEALRQCDVLLATDSGPRHLANAVDTPVAFMRNLAVSRVETGAYCANELDLAPPSVEYLSSSALSSVMSSVSARDAAERLLSLLP
jgi:ADP-heptose:LPS heptosyltransferase